MTEGRLFFIGIGIWLYKWILHWGYQRSLKPARSPSRFVVSLLHGSFFATVGVLLAVTIYAYLGHVRGFSGIGASGGLVGFIFGVVTGFLKAGDGEAKKQMLAIDLEWAQTASSAVIMASIIMYTLVQAFKIPSGSMHPTLYEGDHLFVSKFYYGVRVPFTQKRLLQLHHVQRGDVVVFRFPSEDETSQHYGKDFIKRAIGLPGDTLEVKNKEVFINGVSLGKEPYTQFSDLRTFSRFSASSLGIEPALYQNAWAKGELDGILRGDEIRDNFGPIKVPEGTIFCMGDNRDASYDSRFWGPMPFYYLKGKAGLLYWPPKRVKVIK